VLGQVVHPQKAGEDADDQAESGAGPRLARSPGLAGRRSYARTLGAGAPGSGYHPHVELEEIIERVGGGVDALGVAVTVVGIGLALVGFGVGLTRRRDSPVDAYDQLRRRIGRSILLGLELLVAGDIIRTVGVSPSFSSVGVLAMIIAIRTFLSFTLEVELTSHWPWQRHRPAPEPEAGNGDSRPGGRL
jgi:uncharacterized membrane protein